MPQRNALIVAIDGLRASALGAYGNTSFGTPALDQFAADGFALDWCYAPAAELADVYRALWHARHPMRPQAGDAHSPLAVMISGVGCRATLITDETGLKSLSGAAAFDQLVEVAPAEPADKLSNRADDIADTSIARLFAAACDVVASEANDSGRLIWVHSRGMYGLWDAPLELQEALRDDADPPPVEEVLPPNLDLTADADPDAVFRYSAAYAGQVMALDACWSGLMQALEHCGTPDWLVVLLGARGFPLGEHGRVGGHDARLYAEQLHVPALLRFPTGLGRLARSSALASQCDVLPTIAHWMENRQPESAVRRDGSSWLPLLAPARPAWRDALVFGTPSGSRAIRTMDWCLQQDRAGAAHAVDRDSPGIVSELFVRPDDRWEINDVAKLCPDVVEMLIAILDDVSPRMARDEPLPENIVPGETSQCG